MQPFPPPKSWERWGTAATKSNRQLVGIIGKTYGCIGILAIGPGQTTSCFQAPAVANIQGEPLLGQLHDVIQGSRCHDAGLQRVFTCRAVIGSPTKKGWPQCIIAIVRMLGNQDFSDRGTGTTTAALGVDFANQDFGRTWR